MGLNSERCWQAAFDCISKGQADKAVALCETEPCSQVLECQRYLGWSYYAKADFERAFSWFSKGADRNDGEAMFGLGSIHVARKEFKNALEYFERSASLGYVRSYQWIAGLYHHGCGVPKISPRLSIITN